MHESQSKGYLVVYDAFSQWYHYESKSRGYEDTPEKQLRFKGEIELSKANGRKNWMREIHITTGFPNDNRGVCIGFRVNIRGKNVFNESSADYWKRRL